jgi:CHAT domain-containing protein
MTFYKQLIVLALCLYTGFVCAQTPNVLKHQLDSLAALNQISEAKTLLAAAEKNLARLNPVGQRDFLRLAGDFLVEQEFDDDVTAGIGYYRRALAQSLQAEPNNVQAHYKDYINLTGALYYSGAQRELLAWFEANLNALEQKYGTHSGEIANLYLRYGLALGAAGNYEKSNDYNEKAIRIATEIKSNELLYKALGNKGLSLAKQGRAEEALACKIQVAEYRKRDPSADSSATATGMILIAESLNTIGRPKEALAWLDSAKVYYRDRFQPKDHIYFYLWQANGVSEQLLRHYNTSIQCFQNALEIGSDSILPLSGLTQTYLLQNDFKHAHQYIDLLFQTIGYQPGMNWNAHPNPRRFARDLSRKSAIYAEQFRQSGDTSYLRQALFYLEEIRSLTQFNLNRHYQYYNKRVAYEDFLEYGSQAVELYQAYFNLSRDRKQLAAGFDFAESNKSLLLFQSLRSNRVLEQCALPEALREQEQMIRKQISGVEKQIFEQGETPALRENLLQMRRDYGRLVPEIDRRCKDYRFAEYAFPQFQLDRAQEMLDSASTLLDYVLTDSVIHLFVVNQDEAEWLTFPRDTAFNQALSALTEAMSQLQTGDQYRKNAAIFTENAYFLYKILVEPAESRLKSRVIISPDRALHQLPFELLLCSPARQPDRFAQHDYWLKRHAVHYIYSVAMARETAEKQQAETEKSLLAVAPFYDHSSVFADSLTQINGLTRADLVPLPYSGEEAYKVAKMMGGTALVGDEVDMQSVLAQLPKYRLLHFATHAKANNQHGEYSYCALSAAGQGGILYVKDIYNLHINAEMVVLSACESGAGELREGEGMISLARAFTYAGAGSVLTTLWAVSDEKTKEIMVQFYDYLKKGLPRDLALQQAKLRYLENNRGSAAHPFFWAGFKLIGNAGQI